MRAWIYFPKLYYLHKHIFYIDTIYISTSNPDTIFIFIGNVEVLLLYDPNCPSIGRSIAWLFGRLVCHNFLKGREVTLASFYRSTCLKLILMLQVGIVSWGKDCANPQYPGVFTDVIRCDGRNRRTDLGCDGTREVVNKEILSSGAYTGRGG